MRAHAKAGRNSGNEDVPEEVLRGTDPNPTAQVAVHGRRMPLVDHAQHLRPGPRQQQQVGVRNLFPCHNSPMSLRPKALHPDQRQACVPHPYPSSTSHPKLAELVKVHPLSQLRVRVMALWVMAVEAT